MDTLPDGLTKLADELARRASNASDPAVKAKLIESADKFRAIDRQARSVLSEAAAPSHRQQPRTLGRLCVVAISSFWLLVFLRGFESVHIGIATVFSALLLLVWYLETRAVDGPASRLEVTFAWLWLVLRTVIGAAGALLLLGVPIMTVIFVLKGASIPNGVGIGNLAISFLLGVLCIWVGFAGWSRNPVRDLQLRKQWRDRYGWPL